MKEISELYDKTITACQRADKLGRRYLAFQKLENGTFRFTALLNPDNRPSSYRFMNMTIIDWAQNVLYRMQEEGLIDLPLDEYFENLNRVGY